MSYKSHLLAAAFCLPMVATSVSAGVIFQDDFNTKTGSGNSAQSDSYTNWDGGSSWTVSDGTVDLVANGDWGLECLNNEGYCVDLDGSSSNAGKFVSGNVGPLGAGDYELNFWLSGSQRGSNSELTVSAVFGGTPLSAIASDTFILDSNDPWTEYSIMFSIADVIDPVHILFENLYIDPFTSGDNVGLLLDDVSLHSVPEPSIIVLMGAGLVGLGFARRRKQKA